jgi:hypothetical protein
MGVLGQSKDKGAGAIAPTATGPVDKTGFFSNIVAGFRAAVAGPHSTRVGDAIYQKRTYDDIINQLTAEGEQGEDYITVMQGQRTPVKRPFRNPFVSSPTVNLLNPNYNPLAVYTGGDRGEIGQIWQGIQRVRQRKPDFLKQFPDEAALQSFADKNRTQQQQAAQAVSDRANTSGTIGNFIGGMAGSVASMDPENVVGGGFGTAVGKTFARTIIKRAVEGAGANAAAALVAAPGQVADAQRLGQEMTTGDITHQVVEAAGIGAAFGGAHVILPKTAGAAGSAVGRVADKVASIPPVRDALVARSIAAGTIHDHSLLNDWMRTHNPNGIVDTSSPDERAAAHVILRDAATKETSPLHPEAVGANDHRLDAVAQSLGVDLKAPPVPSTAPIQTPTVRDRSGETPRKPSTYEAAVHQAEGTGKNPDSSADGHFQFTSGTWLEYAPRVTDTKGMSRDQILAMRHDRPTAEAAERLFRSDNAHYLRAHGLEDSPGNLSLAHFLGKGDAAKVLAAAPDTPIERLVDPKSFAANRKVLAGKSASEVVAWAHKRIGAAVDSPVARADAVPDADLLDAEDYSDVSYGRAMFKPEDVETDAALMQYKSGGDANGVTDKLRDVTSWNPRDSGEILVWEGLDGRRVVVDGHQRVGLAKRLSAEGHDIDLPALIIREADGISHRMARVEGALRNINMATGSLLDNARVLRDAPQGAEQIKGAPNRKEIAGLSRLSYEAFGAAINDVIDPRIAAEIGKYAPDPSTHMAMVGLLANARISKPGEAATIVRQALADGMGSAHEEQLGMFGDTPQQSLYVPIARILDAARRKLKEEKRTFRVLSEKSGKIEAAGNVLDRTANEEKVLSSDEALAILDATAHSAGPVRDALIAAARAELSGSRRGDAVSGFLDALSGIDLRTAARGVESDGAPREPFGEAGGRDAAAASDAILADRNEPSLFDHAVAAREAAEPFSDPVGEAAKAQTELLNHDLLMDAKNERSNSLQRTASWVIREKETGAVIMETFDPKAVEALNTAKYEAVPIGEYLGSINGKQSQAPHILPDMTEAEMRAQIEAMHLSDAEFDDTLDAIRRNLWGNDTAVEHFDDARRAVLDAVVEAERPQRAAEARARLEGQYESIRKALQNGQTITSRNALTHTPLSSPEHVKLTNDGMFILQRSKFVFLSREGVDQLAAQAGWKEPALDLGAQVDPAVAARQRQETELKAASPMRSTEEQESTMGLGLFDVADQPTFRLSDEGDAQPLHQIMQEAESDELAAQALRACLKGGEA